MPRGAGWRMMHFTPERARACTALTKCYIEQLGHLKKKTLWTGRYYVASRHRGKRACVDPFPHAKLHGNLLVGFVACSHQLLALVAVGGDR